METIGRYTVAVILVFAAFLIIDLAFAAAGFPIAPGSSEYWRGLIGGSFAASIWRVLNC